MSLDPQARALLDEMGQAAVDLTSLPVELVRAGFAAMGLEGPVHPLALVEDRTLPGPAGPLPVRFYKPEVREGLPCLVYYHGGGFVVGNIDSHDDLCRKLADAAGCAVVSVDYRLAPEAPFPAAPEDCVAALREVAAGAADLGIDPERLAVAGDSAGGCLAAVVAQAVRDGAGPPLRHQVLLYPVTDHSFDSVSYTDNAEGYFLTRTMMQWFWGHYLSDAADGEKPLASPLRAPRLSGVAPATVVTCGYDPLRDEGIAYAARLAHAGVVTQHWHHPRQIHGFLSFGNRIDAAAEAVGRVGGVLRDAFAA